jgi:hypothetical protein
VGPAVGAAVGIGPALVDIVLLLVGELDAGGELVDPFEGVAEGSLVGEIVCSVTCLPMHTPLSVLLTTP